MFKNSTNAPSGLSRAAPTREHRASSNSKCSTKQRLIIIDPSIPFHITLPARPVPGRPASHLGPRGRQTRGGGARLGEPDGRRPGGGRRRGRRRRRPERRAEVRVRVRVCGGGRRRVGLSHDSRHSTLDHVTAGAVAFWSGAIRGRLGYERRAGGRGSAGAIRRRPAAGRGTEGDADAATHAWRQAGARGQRPPRAVRE